MVRTTTRRGFLTTVGGTAVGIGFVGAAGGATGTDSPPVDESLPDAPPGPDAARYAAFNVIELETEQVQSEGDPQAEAAARVIQEVRPDVLVINELTNNCQQGEMTDRTNIRAFVENYLSVPQREDLEGIEYEYTLQPKSNTGVLPDHPYDFNKDGEAGVRPGDAYGFGQYPGHYAFAIASKYPIRRDEIRSFRKFLWADMPDNLIPVAGEEGVEESGLYLTEEELDVYRLSSKTHIDVPFCVDGETVHGLFAHPTPPGYDATNNFNGKWNHDEVRFFADYVADADYIYDDSGEAGGLDDGASYVLMGDMNAGPQTDRPLHPARKFLFENDDFVTEDLPTSPGGAALGNRYATRFGGEEGDAVEQIDYVLPSPDLTVGDSAVVWPSEESDRENLLADVERASDHRLVWADVSTGE